MDCSLPGSSTHGILQTRILACQWASLVAQRLKHLPGMWETWVQSLGQEDPLEKEMATRSSTLTWRIPWREEPGRLQSMGSLSQTRLSDFTFTFHYHALEKDPLQCSCLENPRDGGAWWAAVYEGTQSQTRLKRLSNSSKAVYCHPAYLTDMQSTP